MSKIQLQVGKRYVRRDGRITGALALHGDLFIDSNTTLTWHSGGNYFITEESAIDLISECTEPVLTNTAMTFDELRKRATAAELALIDTVIKLMDEELQTKVRLANEESMEKVKQRAVKFLMGNRPPYRDDIERDPEAMRRWTKRFSEALEEVK